MMTHTANTSKKAMDNPASTEEETYNEEDATAAPPGNTIPHNQALHSPFSYSGMMVLYIKGPKNGLDCRWCPPLQIHMMEN